MNIAALAEKNLAVMENLFGVPVVLIAPDGVRYDTAPDGQPLRGKFNWATTTFNAETGEHVIVQNPCVSLRLTNLTRIPEEGEKWAVIAPASAAEGAPPETFFMDTGKAPVVAKGMGFVKLFLLKAGQLPQAAQTGGDE